MRVKIFYAVNNRCGETPLDEAINTWLKVNEGKIRNIETKITSSGRIEHRVTVMITYIELS